MHGSAAKETVTDWHGPARASFDLISGPSKLVNLDHLSHDGTHRFAERRNNGPGVSKRRNRPRWGCLNLSGGMAVEPRMKPRWHSLTASFEHSSRCQF